MNTLSVVIPNYNGRSLLEENLPLVYKSIEKSRIRNYEIIITDDFSQDDSVPFIQRSYSNILLIENKSNEGFSKNINKGIKKSSKELILILNTDMKLEEDYIHYCLPYFEKKDTFGVMGDVNGNHFKLYKQSLIGITPYRKKGLITSEHSAIPFLLMSGGHSILDASKLKQLGGFDEGFSPFYGEDDDLALRSWRCGWRYYYEGKAKCKHADSSTISNYHKEKFINTIAKRNKLYLNFIHLSALRLAIYTFIQILKLLTYWSLLKIRYYQAFWKFLPLFRLSIKRRNEVKKQSKYRLEYVVKNVLNEQKSILNFL